MAALERYDRDDPNFDKKSAKIAEKRMLWANELCKGDVLDIGCGYGYLAGLCNDNDKVISYYGLDYNKDVIMEIERIYNNDKCKFMIYDIRNEILVYKANTIVCTEFIEHVEKPVQIKLLKEIKEIFDNQGHGLLIGSTPMQPTEGPNKAGNHYHVWEHTYESFKEMVESVFEHDGYDISLIRRYDCGHCIFFEVEKNDGIND